MPGARATVRRDIIIREQDGVPRQRSRRPSSPWEQAEREKGKLAAVSRRCLQKDEKMRLEQNELRARAQLPWVTPEYATTIEQTLQLLAIYRATEQVKSQSLQNLIRTQEKFQRRYMLQHPQVTAQMRAAHQQRQRRMAPKQLRGDNVGGPWQPASRKVPPHR
jgi:hypothetical protein